MELKWLIWTIMLGIVFIVNYFINRANKDYITNKLGCDVVA